MKKEEKEATEKSEVFESLFGFMSAVGTYKVVVAVEKLLFPAEIGFFGGVGVGVLGAVTILNGFGLGAKTGHGLANMFRTAKKIYAEGRKNAGTKPEDIKVKFEDEEG